MINSICTQCTLSPPGAAWLSWVGEPSTFSSAPGSYSPKRTVCFSCTLSCRPIVQCQIDRNDELGISARRELQQKSALWHSRSAKCSWCLPTFLGTPGLLKAAGFLLASSCLRRGVSPAELARTFSLKVVFSQKFLLFMQSLSLASHRFWKHLGSHYSSGISAHFYPSVKLNQSFTGKTLTWCHSIQTLTDLAVLKAAAN